MRSEDENNFIRDLAKQQIDQDWRVWLGGYRKADDMFYRSMTLHQRGSILHGLVENPILGMKDVSSYMSHRGKTKKDSGMTLIAIQKSLFFVRKSTFEVVIPVFFCFVALLTLNVCENNVLNKHALLSKLKPHCKINRILLIAKNIYIFVQI